MAYRDEFSTHQRETYWTLPRVLVFFVILVGSISIIAYLFGWFGETAQVAQQQFGSSALLTKYEWFKDASAALDKKKADLGVYHARLKGLDDAYKGKDRTAWPRDDREQYSIWSSEEAGVKASYNSLAADYNSQMSKFNYRFTNVGDLPRGAVAPLPREYKPYIGE